MGLFRISAMNPVKECCLPALVPIYTPLLIQAMGINLFELLIRPIR